MTLSQAIRVAEKMIEKQRGEEAVALTILVRLSKRVVRLAQPIRSLADALAPHARLDQEPLFREDDKG